MSRMTMLHIRFQGRSYDLPAEELDITSGNVSDRDIKESAARHFEVQLDAFKDYVVERHSDGNITLRPQAVFGVTATESDYRTGILNSLLTTPHKAKEELERIIGFQREVRDRDPIFFGRLGAWYQAHGVVRDHKEVFLAMLLTSDEQSHREAGFVLLQHLPPFQVARVVKLIKENLPKFPRSTRTAISKYLAGREKDPDWFDSVAVIAKKDLKYLYAVLRIKPGERAQKTLFDNEPPPDSKSYGMKLLSKLSVPSEQARLIVKYRLPFRAVVGALRVITPAVLVALIQSMSPQDVINNLGMLSKHGAFANQEISELVIGKLEDAKKDDRVAGFKTGVASEAVKDLPAIVLEKLDAIRDARAKSRGAITRSTALFVDKSGSMDVAIEVGKQLGSLISGVMAEGMPLHTYAFDTIAYPIEAKGNTLPDWEKAFKGITAGNYTSCGVALEYMRKKNKKCEQIIMVTDEAENTAPFFAQTYLRYAAEMRVNPHVIFLKLGNASRYLEDQLRREGIAYDALEFSGDYYSLPGVIDFLARPSILELLMEIMETELPSRGDL